MINTFYLLKAHLVSKYFTANDRYGDQCCATSSICAIKALFGLSPYSRTMISFRFNSNMRQKRLRLSQSGFLIWLLRLDTIKQCPFCHQNE